jgi:hypothetical protein
MPEKTNEREELPSENEKCRARNDERGDEFSWSEDQKKRGYYYDDETNYQIYNPDEEDEEDESDDKK